MARLIVNPNTQHKREVALPRSLLCIGRDPSNDLVLPDAMVSRRHAVVEYRGNQFFLRDCNSSNGSLINGDRVSERNLRDGDLVAIGTARLMFLEDPEVTDPAAKVVPHPSSPRLNCPQCSAVYRRGDAFCKACGERLQPAVQPKVVCTSCGTVVPLPASFCNACGQALVRPGAELEATKPRPVLDDAGATEPEVASTEGEALEDEAHAPDDEAESPEPVALSEEPSLAPAEAEESPPGQEEPQPEAAAHLAQPDAAPAAAGGSRSPLVGRPRARPTPLPPRPSPGRPQPVQAPLRDARARGAPERSACAPLDRRLLAGVIDMGLVSLAQLLLIAPVGLYWWPRELPSRVSEVLPAILLSLALIALAAGLGAVYFIYFWGVRGTTPGKRLLGLVVEGADGTYPIGVSQAFMRWLGYLLSAALLGIGFLMIAFGSTALHDKVAGTRVVVRREGI